MYFSPIYIVNFKFTFVFALLFQPLTLIQSIKKLYTLFFQAIIYKTLSYKTRSYFSLLSHISPSTEPVRDARNGPLNLVSRSSSLALLPPCTAGCPLPKDEGRAHSPSWWCQSGGRKTDRLTRFWMGENLLVPLWTDLIYSSHSELVKSIYFGPEQVNSLQYATEQLN